MANKQTTAEKSGASAVLPGKGLGFSELRFLLKHSSVYGLGTITAQLVGFLLLPLYTRFLTPADYGVMTLVNLVRAMVGLIAGLGMVNALGRFYYEYEEEEKRHRVLSTSLTLAFLLIACCAPIFLWAAPFLSRLIFQSGEYAELFVIALLALLFGLVVDLGLAYLRILAQSVRYIQITLSRLMLLVGLNIYFVAYAKTGVIGIFYSSLIATILYAAFFTILIVNKCKVGFSSSLAKEMLSYSFPLIFSNLSRMIVNQSDKLFINYFFSPLETGLYAVAQKIGGSIHTLVTSPFLQAYIPRRFAIMKTDEAKEKYAHVFEYYFLTICLVGLLLAMFSRDIIVFMTSEEFHSAFYYIPAVILSMILFGTKYHFEGGLLIQKKTKYIGAINAVTGLVNILLNYYLIKQYKIWGAVLSTNISYCLLTTLSLFFSQQTYRIRYHFTKMLGLLASCVIMYFITLLLPATSLAASIAMKLGLFASFTLFLLYTNLIPRELLRKWKRRQTGKPTVRCEPD